MNYIIGLFGVLGAVIAYVFHLRTTNTTLRDQLGQSQAKEKLSEWSDRINEETSKVSEEQKDYSKLRDDFLDKYDKPDGKS